MDLSHAGGGSPCHRVSRSSDATTWGPILEGCSLRGSPGRNVNVHLCYALRTRMGRESHEGSRILAGID
jgi:hypothetical protein